MDDPRAQRLSQFVDWARTHIKGDEKGEAQVFLDRLFQGFGRPGCLDLGTLEFRIKKKGHDEGGTAFADYVWKPVVLIEMKKRGTDLSRHLSQAFDYWLRLTPGRPRYVVLCNFDEFRIYDFDADLNEPQDTILLTELAQHYSALAFLFPTNDKPRFRIDRIAVTQHAADLLAAVYNRIHKRKDVGPQTAQRFILQMLIALFSEDIGLLPKAFVTELLDECTDPPKAFDLLGGLFRAMAAPGGSKGGRFKSVPYFNGGIFEHPAPIELDPEHEIAILKAAAGYNWSHISPDIFGTIFQHSMDAKERHAYGGHYTTPTDIMKIVGPTIVQPWRTAIAQARSIDQLRKLQQRLYTFRVLDPACGSGNFLYIAYRELKRIERELLERIREIAPSRDQHQREFGFVTSKQFFGMDILPFAVELAKVTMTLAHKLAIDELHIEEKALPLDNLDSNIIRCDALISGFPGATSGNASRGMGFPAHVSTPPTSSPTSAASRPSSSSVKSQISNSEIASSSPSRTPWPPADAIIGNPPFLGAKRLKPERGTDYVNAVRALYPEVPGMADYCVYWFRRAHDHLQPATPEDPFRGRAGLVGTQNIRNNQSRVGGLDHIAKSGTIIEAVENQPWSGEANVHVSIANWVKTRSSDGGTALRAVSTPSTSSPQPPTPESTKPTKSPPQPEGLKESSRGHSAAPPPVPQRRESDPEGVEEAGMPSTAPNETVLLIPSPRKLWHKVNPTAPLFDGNPKPARKSAPAQRARIRADKLFELAFRECTQINSALSDELDVSIALPLSCNQEPQVVFNGQFPRHQGFVLDPKDAKTLLKASKHNGEVVHPFMIGRVMLTDGRPDRWVIDFQKRTLLEARRYSEPFKVIEKSVLPHVKAYADRERAATKLERGQDQTWLKSWWQHFRCRKELIDAVERLPRYLACAEVTKRPIFCFLDSSIRPDHTLECFAFADDYSFGILQSDAHWQWFIAKCSKLKSDFRYTPESVFDTFPWPQSPTKAQVLAVAQAGREIRRIRDQVLPTIKGGLRALYRTLELPGKNPLKDAHAALDTAVLDAYGFSPKKDLLKQLLDLNLAVAARIAKSDPATAPGVPSTYANPSDLVTGDCIKP